MGTGMGVGMGMQPPPPPLQTDDTGAGPVALTRVTLHQLNNMYRDLLGDTTAPANANVTAADSLSASTFFVGGSVGDPDVDALYTISDKLATNVVQDLTKLMPGVPVPTDTAGQAMWAQQFIQYFGRRAFRRPVLPAEAADLFALYQNQLAPPISAAFPGAIEAVITGMLMAPAFLYRWELGPQAPTTQALSNGSMVVRFGPFEIASRLSYWLWSSMPDDTLLDAAGKGELSTTDQIKAQIQRMLQDPRANDGFSDFATQWLELTNLTTVAPDPTVFPDFMNPTPKLLSMLAETQRFAASVLGPSGDGLLSTLLTSSKTFIDANLATLYGVPAPSGAGLSPVTLDPTQRAGVFTQAAFLTMRSNPNEANPILRGSSMIRRVFCSPIQMPNINLPPVPDTSPTYPTVRARYEAHANSPCAGTCHQQIDPPGFAFMHYDAVGRWTTTDTGQPVDASGSVTIAPQGSPTYTTGTGATVHFTDAVDFMKQLSTRPEVSDCMTDLLLRYLNNRIECAQGGANQQCLGSGDTESLKTVRAASSNNVRDMIAAFASTNAFLVRMPNPGEVLQ
jgi:hypothetical protein